MRRLIAAIRRDTTGISGVEFALILPVMVILAVGTIEFGRMLMLSQKLQNGTFILADLSARDKTLTVGQLDNMFLAIDAVMQPFEFAESGTAIVTSVTADALGNLVVNWQRGGAGSFTATSDIGAPGGAAVLPDTLSIVEGETVIAAELYYDFEPLFGLSADAHVLRRVAFVRPRLGTLETLLP